jgi:uncharacterized protein (TIGR03437 family)
MKQTNLRPPRCCGRVAGFFLVAGALTVYGQNTLEPRYTLPVVTSVANAASGEPNVIASGTWVSVYGTGFIWSSSGFTRPWLPSDFVNGSLPAQLNDISVRYNGLPTFISYISPTQLNILIPDEPTTGPVSLQEQGQLIQSNIVQVQKIALSPGLFPFTAKYPAAVHLDGTYCGPAGLLEGVLTTPAKSGEVIELYGTGFGASNPKIDFSKLFSTAAPVAQAVSATVGGATAKIDGFLVAPGVYQFNVTIPDLPAGDAAVVLSIAGLKTQAGLSVAITR